MILSIMLGWTGAKAQISVDKLQLRVGYSLNNARAKNFNHLVTSFNRDRFPIAIEENLPSVNFLHGLVIGATYALNENLHLYAQVKNQRDFLETNYLDSDFYRSYLFRTTTLEAGAIVPIADEGRIRHFAGGGLSLGILGVYTDWDTLQGYSGGRNMLSIDKSEILGVHGFYEAQIVLLPHVRLYVRPTIQFALNTQVRKLNQFFNPQVEDTQITFPVGEGETYDKGNLNGMGIEGGLIILLPEL